MSRKPLGELREKDRTIGTWTASDDGATLTLILKDTWDLVLVDGTRGRSFKAPFMSSMWAPRDRLGAIAVPPGLRRWLADAVAESRQRVDALLRPVRRVPAWP